MSSSDTSKSFSIQLANRIKEVVLNGKWVANTNLQDTLEDLSLEEAQKAMGNHNTIAALTFHIQYYISGVLNVFEGGQLEIRDKYSFDMPVMTSEEEWQSLKSKLFTNTELFASHVASMDQQQLGQPFVDEKYGTYQRNIEGMIEHCYYHLGQIVLIRKMLNPSA